MSLSQNAMSLRSGQIQSDRLMKMDDWWSDEYCRCWYPDDDDQGYCLDCGNWINYRDREHE